MVKFVRVTVYLKPEIYEKLRQEAQEKGKKNVQELVRHMIVDHTLLHNSEGGIRR